MNEKFLTIPDVAKRFQVNTTTIYRLVQKGVLPGLKVGGQWRFSPEMLDVWVARQARLPSGGQAGVDRPPDGRRGPGRID